MRHRPRQCRGPGLALIAPMGRTPSIFSYPSVWVSSGSLLARVWVFDASGCEPHTSHKGEKQTLTRDSTTFPPEMRPGFTFPERLGIWSRARTSRDTWRRTPCRQLLKGVVPASPAVGLSRPRILSGSSVLVVVPSRAPGASNACGGCDLFCRDRRRLQHEGVGHVSLVGFDVRFGSHVAVRRALPRPGAHAPCSSARARTAPLRPLVQTSGRWGLKWQSTLH